MSTLADNTLIPLPGFILPRDFAWRVRFVASVDEQLRKLRSTGHFEPPRFFGYFFQGGRPVGVTGNWVVTLDSLPALLALPSALERITQGQYKISTPDSDGVPDFLLVHDSHDGSCWLWRFPYGLRFVESTDPIHSHADYWLGP